MHKANSDTLERATVKLRDLSKELLRVWNQRQNKTALQEMTVKVFGKIHDESDLMIELLHELVNSLPPRQSETIDANSCYEGFLSWNTYWQKISSKNDHEAPIKNVHRIYELWVKETKGKFSDFQGLFEIVMIRSSSEACCETVGSIMNIHAGRNRHLEPVYYSKEIVLRYNLGPLHKLQKKIVDEIYNREKKEYVRRVKIPGKLVTKDVTKSSANGTFQEREEEKSHFPLSFWD